MQKGRAACKVGILRRNVASIGRLVCRLIFLYLVYSTPALAHDPGRESGPAEGNRMLSESLDPKHDRDHDEDRDGHDEYDDGGHGGGEHGHGHFRDWDPDHHGHDHDHDRNPVGGGSCAREPSAASIWSPAASNTAMWNTASNWTSATVPSGSSVIAEFGAATVLQRSSRYLMSPAV